MTVLPSVTQYVKRYYVDQSVVKPKDMLYEGLGKLEKTLDEVVVNYPNGKTGSSFVVQVQKDEKTFDISRVTTLEAAEQTMERVFDFVAPRITSKDIKIVDVEYAVADEMLKTLDNHSGVIPPDVYKEFMIETEGSFGGLGIVIGVRDGQLTVISPLEGTPAYNAGIKPNDKIVQIEDESTVNMSLIEAVGKLRGTRGTSVNVYVMREGFTEPKEFSIVRDIIQIESVEAFNLGNGVGYVRIRDFQKNTLDSLEENITRLTKKDPLKGIVLDLRGNPGGLLDQAERISDVFLKKGVIVTTKIGDSKKRYNARDDDFNFGGKVVVLADSGSASASEIVSGALKNNERAILMGETTFGKGSVQQIFELNDNSALKLTIAAYLTPGDISIQDIGITPDIKLHPAIISKDNVLFNAPTELERENRRYKDKKERKQPTDKSLYSITYLDKDTKQKDGEEPTPEEALSQEEKKKKIEEDFYVKTGKEIILSSNSLNRKEVLSQIKDKISQISEQEELKIEQSWKSLGVDWTVGDNARTPLHSGLSVKMSPSTLQAKAGDKLTLTAEVQNTGLKSIYRLAAVAKSENPLFDGKEFIFGRLNPGEKRQWSTTVEIPKWVLRREDEVKLEFKDAVNTKIPDYKFKVLTTEIKRPIFAFNYEVVDDGRYGSSGNGNGIPEVGETIGLFLKVKNIGQETSQKSVLTLKNLSGDKIFLKAGRYQFLNLAPGDVKDALLTFSVKKADSLIAMELQIADEVFRDGITSKIIISEENKEKSLVNKSVKGMVLKEDTPVRGGSFTDAPVLALASKGSVFDTLGEKEDWLKVKLNENLTGWVKKNDVNLGDFTTNSSRFSEVFRDPPSIEIFNPPLSTKTALLNLTGVVKDKDGIDLISVYVGEDKVKLLTSGDREVPLSFKLKLEDGINLITVVAKDKTGLIFRESFVVRKEA